MIDIKIIIILDNLNNDWKKYFGWDYLMCLFLVGFWFVKVCNIFDNIFSWCGFIKFVYDIGSLVIVILV